MRSVHNLLVTGGVGFIGSNTLVEILERTQLHTVIIDDFSNAHEDVLERVKQIVSPKISSEQFKERVRLHKGNILDQQFLDSVFKKYLDMGDPIDGIMHFAGKKCVSQSFDIPIAYFETNFVGALNLFKMMEKYPLCTNFIFSSTGAVYGDQDNCREGHLNRALSAYGDSKFCVEMLMKHLIYPYPNWKIVSLRYFNPVGAHKSGLIGDEPSSYPNNLVPFIQQVITGKRDSLKVFGGNYDTPDGSCIRDYIHITDIAIGHVKALQYLDKLEKGLQVINLGSGKGYSVLEVLKGMEKAYGKPIKYEVVGRRQGDAGKIVANVQKAQKMLNWKAEKNLDEMCSDALKFTKIRYNLSLN